MTSVINDPANANVRFGLLNFNPSGIDYNSMNYSSSTAITTWYVTNQNKFPGSGAGQHRRRARAPHPRRSPT